MLCFDVPQKRKLTGLELFQKRLSHHMEVKQGNPSVVNKEESSAQAAAGLTSVLSKDTIAKLSDKPGEVCLTKESEK